MATTGHRRGVTAVAQGGGCDPGQLAGARLRQMAIDVATAQVLEHRADRSENPALAELLRERAGERRRRAERLRASLRIPRPAS
jgi:hypothetical protein